jgi:hypothetical protein
MTIRYRTAHRRTSVALPCPPNWRLWWQAARRNPPTMEPRRR